jgi:hypothetical protein
LAAANQKTVPKMASTVSASCVRSSLLKRRAMAKTTTARRGADDAETSVWLALSPNTSTIGSSRKAGPSECCM